jgi:hypothetical protein
MRREPLLARRDNASDELLDLRVAELFATMGQRNAAIVAIRSGVSRFPKSPFVLMYAASSRMTSPSGLLAAGLDCRELFLDVLLGHLTIAGLGKSVPELD